MLLIIIFGIYPPQQSLWQEAIAYRSSSLYPDLSWESSGTCTGRWICWLVLYLPSQSRHVPQLLSRLHVNVLCLEDSSSCTKIKIARLNCILASHVHMCLPLDNL